MIFEVECDTTKRNEVTDRTHPRFVSFIITDFADKNKYYEVCNPLKMSVFHFLIGPQKSFDKFYEGFLWC